MFVRPHWPPSLTPNSLIKFLYVDGINSDIAVKNKKRAFNRMKRTRLQCDIIIFKRCRDKARRVILEAKTSSWQQVHSRPTPISLTRLASNQKLFRTTFLSSHPCVANGISGKNTQHKANILANQFVLSSSPSKLHSAFRSLNPANKRAKPATNFVIPSAAGHTT